MARPWSGGVRTSVVFLCLGAATSVFVSWLTTMGAFNCDFPEVDGESDAAFALPDSLVYHEWLVVQAGWPLPAMQSCLWDEHCDDEVISNFEPITAGVVVEAGLDPFLGEYRLLPLEPLPGGLLIDAIFWGGLLYLLWRRPAVLRAFLRSRDRRCPACGYPMGPSPLCSECGRPRTTARLSPI